MDLLGVVGFKGLSCSYEIVKEIKAKTVVGVGRLMMLMKVLIKGSEIGVEVLIVGEVTEVGVIRG